MKSFLGSLKSYTKNLVHHAVGLVARREKRGEAVRRIATDSRKLLRALRPKEENDRQRRAQKLVKIGTNKYNKREYDNAEKCFRRAIDEDPYCVAAATLLGHTLYQKNQMQEAIRAWKRAHAMDPASIHGQKALKKLQHVERMQADVLAQIRERLD